MALDEGMDEEDLTQHFYSAVEEIVQEFYLMSKVKGTSHVVGYEDHTVIPHTQGVGWDILIRMERLTPLLTWAFAHPMSRRDIIQLGIHMCNALELCQKHQILHRDIKPENIFVSESGDYKLGDFGVARTMEKTMSGMSKKGTYNYMAPEVYKGEEYGFRADMYSVGIVLYRLLNHNRIPFLPPAPERITMRDRENALNRRIQGEELPLPCYAQDTLGQIVCKAAAPASMDRYESPMQMRKALEEALLQETDEMPVYPDARDQQKRQEASKSVERSVNPTAVINMSVTPNMSAVPIADGRVEKVEEEDSNPTVSTWDDPRNRNVQIDIPTNMPMEEESWEDTTEKTTSAFAVPKKKTVVPSTKVEVPTRKREDPKPAPVTNPKKKPPVLLFLLVAVLVVAIVTGVAYVATTKQDAHELEMEKQWTDIAAPIWQDVYDSLVMDSGSRLNYIINPMETINHVLTEAGFSGVVQGDPAFTEKVNSTYDEYNLWIKLEELYEQSEWIRQMTVSQWNRSSGEKTEPYYDAQKNGIKDHVLPDALMIGKTTPMDLGITEEMIQWVYKDDMDFRIAEDSVWKVHASIYTQLSPEELSISFEKVQDVTTKKLRLDFRKQDQNWILEKYDVVFFVGQPGGSGEIGMYGESIMDTIWGLIQKDLTANGGSALNLTSVSMSDILQSLYDAGFSKNYYDEASKIGVYHGESNISFYLSEGQRGDVTTRHMNISPNSGLDLEDAQSVTYYENVKAGTVDAVLPMNLCLGITTLEDLGISEELVQENTDFSTSMWNAYVYVSENDGRQRVEITAQTNEGDRMMDLVFCEADQGYVLVDVTVEFPVK